MPSESCSSAAASKRVQRQPCRAGKGAALARSPQPEDRGDRGHRQDAVVELHRGEILEPVADERCELRIPRRDKAPIHQREGVVGEPRVEPGDKSAGDDRQANEAQSTASLPCRSPHPNPLPLAEKGAASRAESSPA